VKKGQRDLGPADAKFADIVKSRMDVTHRPDTTVKLYIHG
jgi:hypothetical protein